jgi:hypothetical protein
MAVFATEARRETNEYPIDLLIVKSEIFAREIVFLANIFLGSSAFTDS